MLLNSATSGEKLLRVPLSFVFLVLQICRGTYGGCRAAGRHGLDAGLAGQGRGRPGHPSAARRAAAHQSHSNQSPGTIKTLLLGAEMCVPVYACRCAPLAVIEFNFDHSLDEIQFLITFLISLKKHLHVLTCVLLCLI